MSEIFNEDINGNENSSKTLYTNPFISKKSMIFGNNLSESQMTISPEKNTKNTNKKKFLMDSIFKNTNTNTGTNTYFESNPYQEAKSQKEISNETTKFSFDTIYSKKNPIQQSENNDISYSGFFGRKTEGKINGNFKDDEIQKKVNPFENIVEEKENRISSDYPNVNFNCFANETSDKDEKNKENYLYSKSEKNQNSENSDTFKHIEIPEKIFSGKSLSRDESKKEFNKIVKSVTISSFNDTNKRSLSNKFNNSGNSFGSNSSLSKKKSKLFFYFYLIF